jgi:indole-3-glycerol phosphate synthase
MGSTDFKPPANEQSSLHCGSRSALTEFLRDYSEILPKMIIDFKSVSPKDGDLFRGREPVEVAKMLEQAGVSGLSVVTESEHFGGSLQLMRRIAHAVKLPILRKDFIKNEDDLRETLEYGAAKVLLICATIDSGKLEHLHDKAITLGLHPVVEVHNREEMKLALQIGAKIIGINNKDITRLEKDSGTVATTIELIGNIPKEIKPSVTIISESGISTPQDAKSALEAGANAVLIGTAFWGVEKAEREISPKGGLCPLAGGLKSDKGENS